MDDAVKIGNYLAVPTGLILALSVGALLNNLFNSLNLMLKGKIRWGNQYNWLRIIYAFLVACAIMQSWWGLTDLIKDWKSSLGLYLISQIPILFIFFCVRTLFPTSLQLESQQFEEKLLKSDFHLNMCIFYSVAGVYILSISLIDVLHPLMNNMHPERHLVRIVGMMILGILALLSWRDSRLGIQRLRRIYMYVPVFLFLILVFFFLIRSGMY